MITRWMLGDSHTVMNFGTTFFSELLQIHPGWIERFAQVGVAGSTLLDWTSAEKMQQHQVRWSHRTVDQQEDQAGVCPVTVTLDKVKKAKLLILELGTNDLRSIESGLITFANYEKSLIQVFESFNVEKLVWIAPPLLSENVVSMKNQKHYHELYLRACEFYHIQKIDSFKEGIQADHQDGYHMSAHHGASWGRWAAAKIFKESAGSPL